MQTIPGLSRLRVLLLVSLLTPITLMWDETPKLVYAATSGTVVCIHSKSKTVRTHIIVKKKKTCPKGEKKRTWTSQTVPASLCVHTRTRQLILHSQKCPKGTRAASSFVTSTSQKISICINRRTRTMTRLVGKKCPSTARRSNLVTNKVAPQQDSLSNSPAPPTQLSEPMPTTTTTTTTTTVPGPQVILSSTDQTIISGDTTYLVPQFDIGTAVIDQGIGSVRSGENVAISPTVTTVYELTVTINSTTYSARHYVYVNSLAITQHPVDSTIVNGRGIVISVETSSTGILAFTWFKDGVEVLYTASSSFFATTTGEYHVQVDSMLNGVTVTETSSSAVVDINHLEILSHPENVTLGDGESATLSVSATGTGTVSYQWFFEDSPIDGTNSHEYVATNGGSYYVEVTNTISSTVKTERSNGVYVDKNFVNVSEQPVDSAFTTGSDVVLAVGVSVPGNTVMSYQWFFDGQEIVGAQSFSYSASQAGDYKVRITSLRNETTATIFSDTVHVTEVLAPEISSVDFGTPSIAVGNSTTITATFSNGTATLSPGNISLTSGIPHDISPSSTTSYTVTVRNALNTEVFQSRTLIVTTGAFTATANNATGDRTSGSTAVKLLNGKVLVFGSGYNYNATVDLFDPSTNTFTTTGSLRQGRSGGRGVLLDDGRVLVAGGFNGSASIGSAEIYDPSTGQFSYTGSMNFERRNHALVKLQDGRVMVIGGFTNNSANNFTSSTEIYDPDTGVWTLGRAMNFARSETSSVLLHDGRVLIAGGYNSVQGHQKTVEIYDPQTNQFNLLSSQMNVARSAAFIFATPQGAVIIGGYQGALVQSRFEIFNSTTHSFASVVPELDVAVTGPGIAMRPDGVIVIFGGYNNSIGFMTRGYLFDPANNLLVNENATLPIYRSNSTATTLDDGRILFVGETSTSARVL